MMNQGLEGDKDCYIVTELPKVIQVSRKSGGHTCRWVCLVTVLVGILCILATGVALLFLHGCFRLIQPTTPENSQKYESNDVIRVTAKENVVIVTVPNKMDIVYDYKLGIVVERVLEENKNDGGCYARYINEGIDPSQNSFQTTTSAPKVGVNDFPINYKDTYRRRTQKRVPSDLLAPTVARMCSAGVFWTEDIQVPPARVHKRQAEPCIEINKACHPLSDTCKKCIHVYRCGTYHYTQNTLQCKEYE